MDGRAVTKANGLRPVLAKPNDGLGRGHATKPAFLHDLLANVLKGDDSLKRNSPIPCGLFRPLLSRSSGKTVTHSAANPMIFQGFFSREDFLLQLAPAWGFQSVGADDLRQRSRHVAPANFGGERSRLRDACRRRSRWRYRFGKTSGSGKAIAAAYLRAGFGGLVLAAKPEEVDLVGALPEQNGRANSSFFLAKRRRRLRLHTYELARQGTDGIGSVVECLMRILEAARFSIPTQVCWRAVLGRRHATVLRNTIPILLRGDRLRAIPDIVRFVSSAPIASSRLYESRGRKSSFMFMPCWPPNEIPWPAIARTMSRRASYWHDEFAQLDPKPAALHRFLYPLRLTVSIAVGCYRALLH